MNAADKWYFTEEDLHVFPLPLTHSLYDQPTFKPSSSGVQYLPFQRKWDSICSQLETASTNLQTIPIIMTTFLFFFDSAFLLCTLELAKSKIQDYLFYGQG